MTPTSATQKFSKRRKAEFHSTDFPVMRQSIVEMMMKAREDLKNLLSSCKTVPSSLDKEHQPSDERVYTEKDCPGIGKNVLLHGDVLKGYHAYDEAIKSFVVEKVGRS